MDPEILMTISMRLPQTDRKVLSDHLSAVMREAVAAGGDTVTISLQPFDPDEEEYE